MKNTFSRVLASVGAIALAAAFVLQNGLAAEASGPTTVTVAVDSANKMTGSAVSGFNPLEQLRLSVSTNHGTVRFNDPDPANLQAAHLAPNTQNAMPAISLEGTQDQLNAAFANIVVEQACPSTFVLTAQVNQAGVAYNSLNGHYYQVVSNPSGPIIWNDAKVAAEATTFPGTSVHGYLATITSQQESDFINRFVGVDSWMGASDDVSQTGSYGGPYADQAAAEGHWYWVTGPEAGTNFFNGTGANGAAVAGAFTNWNPSGIEPNNGWNTPPGENYGEVLNFGGWNDLLGDTVNSVTTYVVEFGGMPGDAFPGTSAVGSQTVTVVSPLAGSGTQQQPYQIAAVTDLDWLQPCSGEGVYFSQTANLALPVGYNKVIGYQNTPFLGHYDGGGYAITNFQLDVANTAEYLSGNSQSFGFFGKIGTNRSAPGSNSISNLSLDGHVTAPSGIYELGLLVGTANATSISNVTVTGGLSITDSASSSYYLGLLAGSLTDSPVVNAKVRGDISLPGLAYSVGGLAGTFSRWQVSTLPITTSSFDGTISASGGDKIGGLIGEAAGLTLSDSQANVVVNGGMATNLGAIIGFTGDVNAISRVAASGTLVGGIDDTVGGAFGTLQSSTVSDSYSLVNVYSDGTPAGLVGRSDLSSFHNVYAAGRVAVTPAAAALGKAPNTSILGSDPNGNRIASGVVEDQTALTTMSTFPTWNIASGWDASKTWGICPAVNGGKPFLSFEFGADPCSAQNLSPLATVPTPTLSAQASVGTPVSVVPGTWDTGVTLSYQWLRNGFALAGANAATYTPSASDAFDVLAVAVTGQKQGFAPTTITSATSQVAPGNFASTPVPVISGTAATGQTLSASVSGQDPNATVTYQWNIDGSPIAGATNNTYAVGAADFGHTISVTATYQAAGFATVSRTSAGLVAASGSLGVSLRPTITGLNRAQFETPTGNVATASTPGLPGNVSVSYQWKLDGVPIPGETNSTYVVRLLDAGHAITVTGTYTASGYATQIETSIGWQLPLRTFLTVYPTILGLQTSRSAPLVGSTLTGSIAGYDTRATTVTWQWMRDTAPISGANGISYVVSPADFGHIIGVGVTYSATAFDTSFADSYLRTRVVFPVLSPTPSIAPAIGGSQTHSFGSNLEADPDSTGVVNRDHTYTYQWFKDGVAISGATNSSYSPAASDVNGNFTVEVGYTITGQTDQTIVSQAATLIAGTMDGTLQGAISGTEQVGQTLTARGAIREPGVSYHYQWKQGSNPIAGATASTYVLQNADLGTVVSVEVTATKAGFTDVTAVSSGVTVRAAAVVSSPQVSPEPTPAPVAPPTPAPIPTQETKPEPAPLVTPTSDPAVKPTPGVSSSVTVPVIVGGFAPESSNTNNSVIKQIKAILPQLQSASQITVMGQAATSTKAANAYRIALARAQAVKKLLLAKLPGVKITVGVSRQSGRAVQLTVK